MLSLRLLNRLESSAPAPLTLWCYKVDRRSEQLAKQITRPLAVGLKVLSGRKISYPYEEPESDINAMEASGETITTLAVSIVLVILYVDWLVSSSVTGVPHVLVPAVFGIFGTLTGIAAWITKTIEKRKNDKNHTENDWFTTGTIDNFNYDLYSDSLKMLSYFLILIGATVPILSFLISVPSNFTLLGIHLFQAIQIFAMLLVFPFLPYFFGSFLIISSMVAAVVLSIIVAVAILIASMVFGPCMGCVTLLIFETLLAIEMITDPVRFAFKFIKKIVEMASVIDW